MFSTLSKTEIIILATFYLSSADPLNLVQPKNLLFGRINSLVTSLQKLRMVKIEGICRLQNKCDRKIEICFGKGRKHYGKQRKCWLPAFYPFRMFSKSSFLKVKIVWYTVKIPVLLI